MPLYEAMWTSIKEHLLSKYGGDKVTLVRIEHQSPAAGLFEAGSQTLRSPELYERLPEDGRGAMP